MTDDAVSVWCFAGKDMWALTDDDSGHALPAERPQGTRSELRVQRKGEGPILASWPAPAPSTRPSRPEAAILVILENTSGTGWLLLTIAHARNDVPLR